MGLDSVELIMSMEKYFDIRIPDRTAEKIITVGDLADAIVDISAITNETAPHIQQTKERIITAIEALPGVTQPVHPADSIATYIAADDKNKWQQLQDSLGIKISRPDDADIQEKRRGLLRFLPVMKPNYDWYQLTVAGFITAVCAENYKTIINREEISSKEEVYIAVAGISSDQLGIDIYEIDRTKSYTNDLGVD